MAEYTVGELWYVPRPVPAPKLLNAVQLSMTETVIGAITSCADRDGWAWPSQTTLVSWTRLSESTIRRATGWLQAAGRIQVWHAYTRVLIDGKPVVQRCGSMYLIRAESPLTGPADRTEEGPPTLERLQGMKEDQEKGFVPGSGTGKTEETFRQNVEPVSKEATAFPGGHVPDQVRRRRGRPEGGRQNLRPSPEAPENVAQGAEAPAWQKRLDEKAENRRRVRELLGVDDDSR